MRDKEIIQTIKNYRLITNIFEENHKCEECNREMNSSNIYFGDIKGTFKCECGEHFVMANENEIQIYTSYTYDFVGKFIITKKSYYESVDLKNRVYIKNKDRVVEENLILDLRIVDNKKVLTFKYFNSTQLFLEYINECGDFFKEFTIDDFREMSHRFSILSIENRIKPNIGQILVPFCMDYNMIGYLDLLRLIFTNPLVEYMVKGDLTYLIQKNPTKAIKKVTETLGVKKEGNSLKEFIGIPNKALSVIRTNKLGVNTIRDIKDFFEERNFGEFNIIIYDYKFPYHILSTAAILLSHGYKIRRLCDYINMITRSEEITIGDAFMYLNDLRRMSIVLDINFSPYSKNLKVRHDRVVGIYNIQKNEDKKDNLIKATINFEIKQYGKEYYAKPLKTLDDFASEGKLQKNCVLSYVDDVIAKEKEIFSVRNLNDVNVPLATVELKGKRIVQAKGCCNDKVSDEIRDYLSNLARINRWLFR